MIERTFIKEKINDYKIQEYLLKTFNSSSYSHSIIQKTPLGEKIIIFSSKPGLIVGRGGSNIKKVIKTLKDKFKMQSPQVEVQEVNEPYLDPSIVAESVAQMLMRMGANKFKFIGHRTTQNVMNAGAIGVEIQISGKVPSKRSKTWKFLQGYLPKCGNPAEEDVKAGFRIAELKPGIAGVTVKILPPNTEMPDKILILGEVQESVKEGSNVEEVKKKAEQAKKKKEEKTPETINKKEKKKKVKKAKKTEKKKTKTLEPKKNKKLKKKKEKTPKTKKIKNEGVK